MVFLEGDMVFLEGDMAMEDIDYQHKHVDTPVSGKTDDAVDFLVAA